MRVRSVIAVLAVTLAARGANAQQQQPAAACTYDSCALRVEAGWSTHVVRGVEGARVARVGFFAPDLAAVVQQSDSAARHARAFRSDHNRASVLGLVGGVLLGLSTSGLIADIDSGDDPSAWEWAALGGGIGLSLGSAYYQLRAQRSLQRSMWWYNRDLPR